MTDLFKISAVCDWLQLILHNQLALTIFGRCKQYTIDSMVYFVENEVVR